MDIRTKLILALVSVSLVSMAILGVFAYKTSASLLQEISVRQLDALAQSKKTDLLKVYESWQTQVRLIGSRTRLRFGLRDYQLHPGSNLETLSGLDRILNDVVSAADDVVRITLFGKTGDRIISVGEDETPFINVNIESLSMAENGVTYAGSFPSGEDEIRVRFLSPLTLDDEWIGAMEIVIDANDITTVTKNYTGLGKTGEVLVVVDQDPDTVFILNSVRHETGRQFRFIDRSQLSVDMSAALAGEQKVITSGSKDYRGVDVWSATRFIPGLDWGLIVKVDAEEEREREDSLREIMIDLALALSAFAVVGGTILGVYLARPIQNLARVVCKLRDGDLSVRAEITGDDEVAYLADSLNHLMDEMQAENKKASA